MNAFEMDEPGQLLGLAQRRDDPVPGLDDERLEAMLDRALRSDAEADAALVPPGEALFGEADGAGDPAPWHTDPGDGTPEAGEPAPDDDAAADMFGVDPVDRVADSEDIDPGEYGDSEPWSVDP